MKNKNEYHMNIGGASIILLLIVFALTVFAALSVRASYHEMRLAEKNGKAVEAYYSLDSAAEIKRADISQAYDTYLQAGGSKAEFTTDAAERNGEYLSYTVSNDAGLFIKVLLKLEDDGSVTTLRWRLAETEQGDYGDFPSDIWHGDIEILD